MERSARAEGAAPRRAVAEGVAAHAAEGATPHEVAGPGPSTSETSAAEPCGAAPSAHEPSAHEPSAAHTPSSGDPSTPHPPGLARPAARFLGAHRRDLVFLALWSLLEAGQTWLLGYALARALDDGFLAGENTTGIGWLAVAGGSVAVAAYGTGRVYRCVAALVEPARDALVRRVVRRALDAPDDAAVSRLTHQVEIARDTLAGLILVLRSFVFTAIGALAGLFVLAPELLLVVAPPLAAGLVLFAATLRPLARSQERFLAADETVSAELGRAVGGLRDIRAAGAERRVAAAAAGPVDAERAAAESVARWAGVRVLSVSVGGRLPILLLLVTAPWLLRQGVSPGVLAGALVYLTQSLLPALQALMEGLGTTGSRLFVVLRRLLAEPAATPPVRVTAPPDPYAIGLSQVTFGYGPQAEPVLNGIDLEVPAGAHLAVVGPSGSGKSTLTALIAGLLAPGGGEVRALADRVLVPQEAYVFSGTVRENLAYLCPRPPADTEILAAAERIGSAELTHRMGGLDAQADPAALSAGERQLLALTRAYLAPARLVLLDEAASELDPAAELRAERAFRGRPDTTLVVVAHRAGAAARADLVLDLDTAAGRLTHQAGSGSARPSPPPANSTPAAASSASSAASSAPVPVVRSDPALPL
uniref:ATP-binding cassette domain-containing protein n=1 Tax=Streptomyces polyasparticus TaxID=2767826 RepID=UPI00280B1368|nr:ATP-binding cassette domain-containing protein [Streptomyces polyasparticus]